ncbi:LacI family DNA-binding transcriptional regulator [Microbacterium sp. AK031]|uniref:LacI family DNA-binding transcriptional regulator n=1 Tax=Microbacterium sp. AK031 TaxID=2723076 RepID=UPI0021695AB9|nr:LacI family DNA-binding transcriptional regulator [Microbacterium sp. AK031]MCS3844551.1 LacI family transcriptional regulator [Microbacterium sp. AK031]
MPRTTGAPRRRTLQDVADALGLTVNTVSRALRDLPGVSEATRARIKAEAERIGYVPNANARSLVLGSRRTIGVIITDLANPFFNDLVTAIEEQAIQEGYTLLLLLSDEDPDREQFAVDTALRSGVDGIIAVPVQGRSNPWTAVTKAGIPLVIVARELPDLEADFYSTDNEAGRRMTTAALIERGATDIVLVEEDLQISTVAHRLGGFRDALEAHGIPFDSRRTALVPSRRTARGASLWRGEDAHRVGVDLLESGRVPHAFMVGNDYFALGIYAALRDRGIRIPEDVMVIGWGDYPFSRYMDPPLSTVRLPVAEVARRATQRLLALLNGTATEGVVADYLEPDVMLRASTGPVSR